MKKVFILACLVASVAFVSCTNDEEDTTNDKKTEIKKDNNLKDGVRADGPGDEGPGDDPIPIKPPKK
ncbi:MAG: hypothetical protein ABI441_05745 [Flavobacterium sp.]